MTIPRKTLHTDLSEVARAALAAVRATKRPKAKRFLFLLHFSDSRGVRTFRPTYGKCIWSDTIAVDNVHVRRITSSLQSGEYTALYVAKIGLLPSEEAETCKYVSHRATGKIGNEYGLRIPVPSRSFKRINIRYDTVAQRYELDT
jgi:hypothetical protein